MDDGPSAAGNMQKIRATLDDGKLLQLGHLLAQ
jgi:hypothetical protein